MIWDSHSGSFDDYTIFWDITPCSPLRVNRRFGRTHRLHLQGRKNKLSKKPAWEQVALGFLLSLFFRAWKWRRYVPPKLRLTQRTTRRYISRRWYSSIQTWLTLALVRETVWTTVIVSCVPCHQMALYCCVISCGICFSTYLPPQFAEFLCPHTKCNSVFVIWRTEPLQPAV
jgi:hypothetical protein